MLALHPGDRWQVTLVSPSPELVYSGMVPGHFAGHYGIDECTVDLRGLCARARATLMLTSATLVSPGENDVVCADASVVPYDVLSVDVGGVSNLGGARGVERHALALRPLEMAIRAWDDVLLSARAGRVAAITVVGAGLAAVEIALAMSHRFRRDGVASHVRVLGDARELVPSFPARARAALLRRLRVADVEAHGGSAVTEVGPGYLRLKGGIEFATDAVFWATGVSAHPWIRQSGFATDDHGFMLVNDLLQSPSHPNVFGAGDCVNELGRPLPKAGVFAVRAGPALAANLMAALDGGALVPHVPKPRHLAIVSAGEKYAVAAWDGMSTSGAWVWRWKDRIDRRFIARYRESAP